jgi:hypothetical protein
MCIHGNLEHTGNKIKQLFITDDNLIIYKLAVLSPQF